MGQQQKRHTKRSNPPGNPTGKSHRVSPQKKAERAIWRQFGAKPFNNPDKFGWVDTVAQMKSSRRQVLIGPLPGCGGRNPNIDTDRCPAANTVGATILEMLFVEGMNTVGGVMLETGELRGQKGLFEHKRSPFNEHDIAFVEECPDSSLERTALYLQQRSVFKPSAGESAAALEARYEPIDEVYTLQSAAVERRGIIVIIGSKCYVAAAAGVERSLDERGRQQQQQQQQDAPPPLERVVEAPESWRQFDPLNCLVHRMMAACAGSCGPAGPQAAAAGGSGSNGSEGSAAPERTFTLSQLMEAGVGTECHNPKEMYCAILKEAHGPDTSKLERSLWEGQELPDGVVIRNDKQRVSAKAMLDLLARLEAAGFTPLVDLFECSSFGIHLLLPADHQTAGLTADMLEHMLKLRSGTPEASGTGLARMLEVFGKHHQSQGAEYLAAVLRGRIPPDFEILLQAGHAVLCDLQQFFQQRREKYVQREELERQEEEGSVTAEQGAAWPGQAAAANNAGKSTRSSIVSAGPTAPLARKNQPWTAQEDANLHAAAADPANRRPPRQTGRAKFDTVIDWQLVGAAVGRPAEAVKIRYFKKHGSVPAQLSAQPAAQPAAQHTLDFGHALLGEVLHVPAFSAAGDPRLAGVTSLRVRTAVVRSDGKVDLTHAIAGAKYALDFDQIITRSQLVAVRSPSTGRSYLGNVLELHCASLLGIYSGLDARGGLLVAEADLEPFEVAWDDAAALRGHVLSRLLDVNMQCNLRSIVNHLSTAASRLAPALLAIAGVDCFDPSMSWAHGATTYGGVLNVDKWRQSMAGSCGPGERWDLH
ncbi:hypothetical protein D9Q98_002619 [Chlorella vulgaris]|uniref:Uncharacterized protein n=1 Tax=Chlorella vulgaris TaxID=3077 RepID=A0A9D4TTR0_CHLVU|nr:hypothetical protein D9Q98_002619 [Chlorella vulgaris]